MGIKRIVICGATGNIGSQTIDLIKNNNKKYQLVGISYYSNQTVAKQIIDEFKVPYYYCDKDINNGNVKSLDELIQLTKPDLVVNAVSGFAGVNNSICVIKHKINLALANKESLVTCGKFIMPLAQKNKVNIYPIDSEHSAVYSLIKSKVDNNLKEIIITASGGPFYNRSISELNNVTYTQALKNPNWVMGEKVSIDSSTLLNKAFEIIECYWLFNTSNIKAMYHPQSLIHAMVRLNDDKVYAFISKPDMHLPISMALDEYQHIDEQYIKQINLNNCDYVLGEIDNIKFPCFNLAQLMLNNINGPIPIVVNACDEQLIKQFKSNQIKFNDFYPLIKKITSKFKNLEVNNINDVFLIDSKVRECFK